MNKSDESYLFSFFEIAQSLIAFLIVGNLTECVQVQLTWKLLRFFDTWREAQFSSPIPVVPSWKKKKRKEKKERLSIARTKIDHERYRLLSTGHSGILCFVFQLSFLIVTYSSQFTWQGHRKRQCINEQWAKTSHCFQTVRSRQLSRVVVTRAYLATRKIQEKDKKKTRKEKKNERRRNQYARVRRYKITSTLGSLVRGDPQNEGLLGLQPCALGSKLDYFHAGITSTRLHRQERWLHIWRSISIQHVQMEAGVTA